MISLNHWTDFFIRTHLRINAIRFFKNLICSIRDEAIALFQYTSIYYKNTNRPRNKVWFMIELEGYFMKKW